MIQPIPFVDLRGQYRSIRHEVDPAIQAIVDQTAFIGGKAVSDFEAAFAALCAIRHCVGVGNGTDALYLAMRALGLGPGDEVITVSHTFIATAEGISLTGATPVFVDIDAETYLMDANALEGAVSPRTKAIVAVHLYGQPVDMTPVMAVAKRHGLKVIEDAAQAHGARDLGARVGGLGDVACFSFYPGKNLGAYGDGGAVVTGDTQLAERIRMLANHGRRDKYLHEMEGVNSRLDALQAAVLGVKLRYLDSWNEARRNVAMAYREALAGVPGVVLPQVRAGAEPVWHLFVIQAPDRDGLRSHLTNQGIGSGVHYPVPLHRQPAYEARQIPLGRLPATEFVSERILSLPIFPELSNEAVARIASAVADYASARRW